MRETAVCPIGTTNVSISGTTARGALGGSIVRISTNTDCFIKFGDSTVTAATTDCPLYAGQPEYFNTEATGNTYVAAITTSASGNLSIVACK